MPGATPDPAWDAQNLVFGRGFPGRSDIRPRPPFLVTIPATDDGEISFALVRRLELFHKRRELRFELFAANPPRLVAIDRI